MNDKPEIKPKGISPLKYICMTIGELPSSYLETMTYYEMLIWFTKFLQEKVIPTIDNNAQAVEELQDLFIELQSYVNNYFDNLDVQDEINNKLDQMLEDGILEQIIEQFIQSSALWCFDNVANMKVATNLIDGSYAYTLGFYELKDGGNATYKIRNKYENEEANEITTIALNDDSLIAELDIDKEINVLKIGCKRNQDFDNKNIIQYILNNYDKIMLYFPIGRYQFNSELTIPHTINFKGDKFNRYIRDDWDQNSSILYYKAHANNKTFITQESTSWQVNIENIAILTDAGTFTDKGLDDSTVPYNQYEYTSNYTDINGINYYGGGSWIKNSSFSGFSGYGVNLTQLMRLWDCTFFRCNVGAIINGQDISMYDCYFTNGVKGLYRDGGANIFIYDTYFDLLVEHGIEFTGAIGGKLKCFIDHTGYAGISCNSLNKLIADVNCYRTGMYNSGLTLEELKNADINVEKDNFKKGSGIFCNAYIENTNLTLNAFPISNDDAFTSTKKSPVCSLYAVSTVQSSTSSYIYTPSVINLVDDNNSYIKYKNDSLFVLNNTNGLTRYSKSKIYDVPFCTTQTYNPNSSQKTTKIGDLWFCSANGKLFVATAIDGTTGDVTWKEIQYVS